MSSISSGEFHIDSNQLQQAKQTSSSKSAWDVGSSPKDNGLKNIKQYFSKLAKNLRNLSSKRSTAKQDSVKGKSSLHTKNKQSKPLKSAIKSPGKAKQKSNQKKASVSFGLDSNTTHEIEKIDWENVKFDQDYIVGEDYAKRMAKKQAKLEAAQNRSRPIQIRQTNTPGISGHVATTLSPGYEIDKKPYSDKEAKAIKQQIDSLNLKQNYLDTASIDSSRTPAEFSKALLQLEQSNPGRINLASHPKILQQFSKQTSAFLTDHPELKEFPEYAQLSNLLNNLSPDNIDALPALVRSLAAHTTSKAGSSLEAKQFARTLYENASMLQLVNKNNIHANSLKTCETNLKACRTQLQQHTEKLKKQKNLQQGILTESQFLPMASLIADIGTLQAKQTYLESRADLEATSIARNQIAMQRFAAPSRELQKKERQIDEQLRSNFSFMEQKYTQDPSAFGFSALWKAKAQERLTGTPTPDITKNLVKNSLELLIKRKQLHLDNLSPENIPHTAETLFNNMSQIYKKHAQQLRSQFTDAINDEVLPPATKQKFLESPPAPELDSPPFTLSDIKEMLTNISQEERPASTA